MPNFTYFEVVVCITQTFFIIFFLTLSQGSQTVFRGTKVLRGAIFSVPRTNKKNKKHTSSNEEIEIF
jgi:hypothetical protein